MNFTCITEAEVRRKYRDAEDKQRIIGVLADLTGSTKGQIREFLGLTGEVKRGPQKLDKAEAMRLYQAGLNDKEIGDRLGVSPECVGYWRRRNGLPSNYKPARANDHRMELYRMGKSDPEIAKAVGVATPVIFKWRKRRGLPANLKSGYNPPRKPAGAKEGIDNV